AIPSIPGSSPVVPARPVVVSVVRPVDGSDDALPAYPGRPALAACRDLAAQGQSRVRSLLGRTEAGRNPLQGKRQARVKAEGGALDRAAPDAAAATAAA